VTLPGAGGHSQLGEMTAKSPVVRSGVHPRLSQLNLSQTRGTSSPHTCIIDANVTLAVAAPLGSVIVGPPKSALAAPPGGVVLGSAQVWT
jgi:hypothetical protein